MVTVGIRHRLPKTETLLRVCVLACLVNVVLVSVLAGAGVLRTTERGDITYTRVEATPDGDFVIPSDSPDRFVIERPTDVDAYYDMVVRFRNGGPMFNPWGDADTIQRYHYHPVLYFLLFPLSFAGYLGFQLLWLLLSILSVVAGSFLILRAEVERRSLSISGRRLFTLAVLSAAFVPMVSNYKVGQASPPMYFGIAGCWWAYRTERLDLSVLFLLIPAVIKPYFITPLVLFGRRDRWRGVATFTVGILAVNLFVVVTLGPELVVRYYEILLEIGLAQGGEPFQNTGFGAWFSNSIRMHFLLGSFHLALNLVGIGLLAWFSLLHVFNEGSFEVELFAMAVAAVNLIISLSVMDIALVLASVLVLGVEFYDRADDTAMAVLAGAFLLIHVHSYFMEVTVGAVGSRIPVLVANESLVVSVVPYLQPGMYGLFLILGLCVYAAAGAERVLLPQFSRWRHALGIAER